MAARFFINGGIDNNWGSTSNWSTTSGGGGGSAVPSSSDDVTFDNNSPNCTVNSVGRTALTLTFTSGYSNTITMTQGITVSGSVTLSATMSIAGSGTLTVNLTATLTSNGKTWPNPLTLSGNVTHTLADDWVVSGLVTVGSGSGNTTINSFQVTCNGSLRSAITTGTCAGSTLFILTGGTFDTSSAGTGRAIGILLTFAGGSITVNSPCNMDLSRLLLSSGSVTTAAGSWAGASGGLLVHPGMAGGMRG